MYRSNPRLFLLHQAYPVFWAFRHQYQPNSAAIYISKCRSFVPDDTFVSTIIVHNASHRGHFVTHFHAHMFSIAQPTLYFAPSEQHTRPDYPATNTRLDTKNSYDEEHHVSNQAFSGSDREHRLRKCDGLARHPRSLARSKTDRTAHIPIP